jgi:uncharacterized protein YcaQ
VRRLTKAQVRRAHIAAQGLASPRPAAPNLGHVVRSIQKMGVVQIDSVNVVERAHQLTLFSRLGPYDPDLLWRAQRERRVLEYWAHMASFLPIDDWPLYKFRMERTRAHGWPTIHRLHREAPGYIESVRRQLEERGPLTTSDLDEPGDRKGPWWGWADGKHVLEWLFIIGDAAVAERRNFTRYYDLAERVIPADLLDAPAVPLEEAVRILLMRSAERMAVATAKGLADYYRVSMIKGISPLPRRLVEGLAAEGSLVEVDVAGMTGPMFMHPDATIPRTVEARALLNPFDPIVWFRDRTEQLYDFHYRVEIYVPAAKRVHGYYVFPFLLGDELVARVDIKADRQAGVLRVPGAFLEDGHDPVRVAREMAIELGELARWLGLGEIAVGRKGDLVSALRSAV